MGGWSITGEGIAGAIIYALLFFCTVAMYIYKRCKSSLPCQSMATIFYVGLPTFMLCLFSLLF